MSGVAAKRRVGCPAVLERSHDAGAGPVMRSINLIWKCLSVPCPIFVGQRIIDAFYRGALESPPGRIRAARRNLKGKQGLILVIEELSFVILRPRWKYDNSEGYESSEDPRELSFSSTIDVC
jgi:hypothetical protein